MALALGSDKSVTMTFPFDSIYISLSKVSALQQRVK